jgi:hypothetical protein
MRGSRNQENNFQQLSSSSEMFFRNLFELLKFFAILKTIFLLIFAISFFLLFAKSFTVFSEV